MTAGNVGGLAANASEVYVSGTGTARWCLGCSLQAVPWACSQHNR